MTDWAIGDIQGCAEPFFKLLNLVDFNPKKDTLWVAGDMVNRGPDNLSVLRFLRDLGPRARIVLGNHDLHLLAASVGARELSAKDTVHDILTASDCTDLLFWLAQQPLVQVSDNYIMTHAGIPPQWSDEKCVELGDEVTQQLRDSVRRENFLHNMYGNKPATWCDSLDGFSRLRVITNYLTRMRFIDDDGTLDFSAKESIASAPAGFKPWFSYPRESTRQILFGHWAALSGVSNTQGIHALDTGCVWGGTLTLLNLETQERVATSCARK